MPRIDAHALKRHVRRAFRLSALVFHVAVGAALVSLVYPLTSREVRLALRARWCRHALRALGVELRITGTVPTGCHLMAANHISWLDTFALGAVFPCCYVSKAETRAWPFLGWMAAANDTLFLRRGSARAVWRMNAEIRSRLALLQPVVVFPEGTTTDGTKVLAFYPALFQPAIDSALPVLPLALSYNDGAGHPATSVAYINDDPLWKSLRAVLEAPRIRACIAVHPALEAAGTRRRDLALQTCQAIRRSQLPHTDRVPHQAKHHACPSPRLPVEATQA
jgi:1-acyl-sn-glycerol-3-phosphate acyltransferase